MEGLGKKMTVEKIKIGCNTVGDLLDELVRISKDANISRVLDASIDGVSGETFTGFTMTRRKLSDRSEVIDFELTED